MNALFGEHIAILQQRYEESLRLLAEDGIVIEAVLLHSGNEGYYFADDREIPFRAHAHFNHWVPVNRPDQMVLIVPGRRQPIFRSRKPISGTINRSKTRVGGLSTSRWLPLRRHRR